MKKSKKLQQYKLALTSASIVFLLAACGGGSSSSDKADSDSITKQNNNLDECLVSRVAMSPESGNISKKSTQLRADIDIQLPKEVVDFDIFAIMCPTGHCDDGYHKTVERIFTDPAHAKHINGHTGRAFLSFDMRNGENYSPLLGRYGEVRVVVKTKNSDGSTSGCEVTQQVNFTLVE